MHFFHLVSNGIKSVLKNNSSNLPIYSLTAIWTSLMKMSFLLSVSLDSGKDESQTGPNQVNKQFKATIMDFSHQLYACVNTRVVCPFSQKVLLGLT